jgi:hypothetical protein
LWYGCGNFTLVNYWFASSCGAIFRRTLDDRLTRGGPLSVNRAGKSVSLFVHTDDRKPLSISVSGDRSRGELGGRSDSASLSFTVKPTSALTVSTGPEWSQSRDVTQYVTTEQDASAASTFGRRDVFATLDQKQLTLTTRVSYVLTPRSSLQLFMQPLLATGGYGGFKELATPGAFDYFEYGTGSSSIAYDPTERRYAVDPDLDGPGSPFSFDDPNFNFKSLRVNAIFRWEVRPGSTLYVVWTQQREDFSRPGVYQFRRDAAALFSAPPNDIFLVKMAYWVGK